MYGNEREVGEGIRASGIKREEMFVTTKVAPDNLAPASARRDRSRNSVGALRLGEIDLLLLHWPNKGVPLAETIDALVEVKRDGLVRHIGVSNYTVALIEEASRLSGDRLVCNQIEMSSLSRPVQGDRGLPRAWHGGGRLFADREGQRQERCRAGAHRQGAWQDRGAGLAALSGAAGHRRHPAHQQGRAAGGEYRDLRFRTDATRRWRDRRRSPARRRAWSTGPGRRNGTRSFGATTTALVLFSGGRIPPSASAGRCNAFARVETVGFDYGQRHAVELDVSARSSASAARRSIRQWADAARRGPCDRPRVARRHVGHRADPRHRDRDGRQRPAHHLRARPQPDLSDLCRRRWPTGAAPGTSSPACARPTIPATRIAATTPSRRCRSR